MKHEYVEEISYSMKCQHCGNVWSEYIQPHWKVKCTECGLEEKLEQVPNMDGWK